MRWWPWPWNPGAHAQSFTGSQAGVLTTERHGNARIVDVTPGRLTEALDEGKICIVAGFQELIRNRAMSPRWAAAVPIPPRWR